MMQPNLLDPVAPLPTDPLGFTDRAEIRHTIPHLNTADAGQILALCWRRPGAAAQLIAALVDDHKDCATRQRVLTEQLLMERARIR